MKMIFINRDDDKPDDDDDNKRDDLSFINFFKYTKTILFIFISYNFCKFFYVVFSLMNDIR